MLDQKDLTGRYLAFAFTDRPNGGMGDCIGSFDTASEADQAIKLLRPVPVFSHIFDTEERQLVDIETLMKIGDSLERLNS